MSTDGLASEISPLIHAVNRALERLESAIAAQKRFTANAAHELRTPLAVLRARVDGFAPGPDRAALIRDIERLTRAVSQMLLTARLQSHQMGDKVMLDLAALVRDVVADVAPLAQAGGGDIVLETQGRPFVRASASALESAVRNLIENALRFSPTGDAVTVRVRPGATVEVEDSGHGVAQADRGRVFEPFWRATDQRGSGAGLGLAIVREVADQHGGTIAVEDAIGGGAKFLLTVPECQPGDHGTRRAPEAT
jgi:signal transduction histidine kinase